MPSKIIFGFGSLINPDSLRSTVVDATDIKPAYVKGFFREFNLWNPIGFKNISPELTGIPYCALDIKRISDPKARVNGVAFAVNEAQLKKLRRRERGYKLIRSVAYDFNTDEKFGECYLFSACKNDGKYDFSSSSQTKYLGTCIKGAKKFGNEFYREFLNTTHIGDKTLSEVLELLNAS